MLAVRKAHQNFQCFQEEVKHCQNSPKPLQCSPGQNFSVAQGRTSVSNVKISKCLQQRESTKSCFLTYYIVLKIGPYAI
jgi:hypothetical protein